MDKVPSEPLFALLTAVRSASPPPSTGISTLDPLKWGDVVEIQAPSGAGKSQLLYFLLATCIMPFPHGWGKAAVIFDTDGTFNARQFRDLLVFRLAQASGDATQPLAIPALHRLHVFRPSSSTQLAASILHLSRYHATNMADADIAIVAVDSISAFYWPDRFTAEQLRPGHANYIPPLQNVLAALQKFRQSHQAVTILTNWGLNPADNSSRTTAVSPVLFYKQHLPSFPTLADRARPPSTLSLTHQITLSASPSPPFHGTLFIPQNLERCEITGCIRTSNSTNSFVVDIPPEMYKSST